uniref:Uncharacterized protein n=1 Tax=Glossina pallidipes TaxID=7398 RepID=A0A1A9ZQ58_GLOPL
MKAPLCRFEEEFAAYCARDGVVSGASTLAGRNLSKHKIKILGDGVGITLFYRILEYHRYFHRFSQPGYRARIFCGAVEDMVPEEIRVVVSGYNRPVNWWSFEVLTKRITDWGFAISVQQQNVTYNKNIGSNSTCTGVNK